MEIDSKLKTKEYNRLYREKNRERLRLIKKKWRQEKREECLEADRKYRKENFEKIKQTRSNWFAKNPNKEAEYSRKKRALKRKTFSESYSIDMVLELYGTKCHICNEEINLNAPRTTGSKGWEKSLHLDHVIPLSKNGTDTLDNIKPSHALCNLIKGNKINEWSK
jgi:5-methylcytosine-specific restriction endonuclease McrA